MSNASQQAATMSADIVRTFLSMGLSSEAGLDLDEAVAGLATTLSASNNAAKMVIADLTTCVCDIGTGPLSIDRLTGCQPGELKSLVGKTLLDALTSPETPAQVLGALSQYGELLMAEVFPEQTRTTGAAIYSLALSAAISRNTGTLAPTTLGSLSSTLRILGESRDMPDQIRANVTERARAIEANVHF